MFQEKNARIGEKTASSKSQPTLKKIKKITVLKSMSNATKMMKKEKTHELHTDNAA